jgi:hypothetical protein
MKINKQGEISMRQGFLFSIIVSIIFCSPVLAYDWSTNPGDGSPENPYLVSEPNQLIAIDDLDTMGIYFVLVNDIDLDPNLSGSQVFDSAVIASEDAFEGLFDGQGYVIRNMQIIDSTQGISFVGLFGKIGPEGIVKNLTISDYDIRVQIGGNFGFAGSLAGQNLGLIINCVSNGSAGPIVEGQWFKCMIGGLVGINGNYNYYNGGDVDHRGSITNCSSHSNLTILYGGGGLVSYNLGSIYQCYSRSYISDGELISVDTNGGLVGANHGVINQCFSNSVVATGSNSGLCGWNTGIIRNCYALGVMKRTCQGCDGSAGLVLDNYDYEGNMFARIENCYAACQFEDSDNALGLAGGGDEFYGSAISSFWDMEVSGTMNSWFGQGLTTVQMKDTKTYLDAGWDFTNIWMICEGTNYPRFQWQILSADFVCPDGVNTEDLKYYVDYWLTNNCTLDNNYCGGADLDYSGSVDLVDWAIVAENWLLGV